SLPACRPASARCWPAMQPRCSATTASAPAAAARTGPWCWCHATRRWPRTSATSPCMGAAPSCAASRPGRPMASCSAACSRARRAPRSPPATAPPTRSCAATRLQRRNESRGSGSGGPRRGGAMSPRRRTALALLWLAALLVAGWAIGQRLELSGDLRRFMPEPRTPAQALLVDELGDGPGTRLLLVSLSGAAPEVLAAQSRALAAALAANPDFEFVTTGADAGLGPVPESLRPHRPLLSPSFDDRPLDAAYLGEQLAERLQDLGSPMAALVEPLLPADPTLEMLVLAEAWQPKAAPQRLHGVWFDAAGRESLLLAQTGAAGFDPSAQQRAYDAVYAGFAEVAGDSGAGLRMTGPGAFSVEIGGRTAREAQWIGTID